MTFSRYLSTDDVAKVIPADNVKFHPPTGISVLVVGAGVGGIVAALECKRKGHDVRIIERTPEPSIAGDFFSIAPHIIYHFILKWPDLATELERINYEPFLAYHKITGERVSGPEPVTFVDMPVTLPDGTEKVIHINRQNRPKFVAALLAQLRGAGIEVTYGQRVVDYFDDVAGSQGGAVLDDGTRLTADVVVAADGVGTKSTKLVAGKEVRAGPSGYAILRTAFHPDLAFDDPEIKERWPLIDGWRPVVELWQGDNLSFGVGNYGDIISWHMIHKGDGSGSEAWSKTVDVSKVLDITAKIPGFPEVANRLIKKTPDGACIDWELFWRDPRETWASPAGRVIQIGDAAHTLLPSSGNGANQAMEDAISLATCLQVGGRNNVNLATRIHNILRYERVSCFQLVGFINHQRQNKTNFAAVAANGQPFKSHIGKWAKHDPEQYAYDNYGKVLQHLLSGASFVNTNVPPGYVHHAWSIQELFDQIEQGKPLQFEGDWD